MSLWEFAAVMGGVAVFNGAEMGLSREDADAAAAMLDGWRGGMLH